MNNGARWVAGCIFAAFLFVVALTSTGHAQTPVLPGYQICSTVSGSTVCSFQPTDLTHPLPVAATASIAGFNQETVLTPFTATTGGVTSGAFTAGKVVVVTNAGTTNMAYCRLGAASTTSGQPVAPNGGWFAFTTVAETTVTCATSASTTTVNVSVGTGLPTGTGGGGGSGSGGDASAANQTAVQAPVAAATATATKGNLASGQYLASLPTMTDTQQAAVTFDVNGRLIVLEKNSAAILTAVQAAVPPQSPAVPIGGVSICDGANGTTNPCTTPATVKAASTPAAATDKAIVVDQRPGTNITVIGPTVDGSAASTPPVLIAGTVDGTATGAVAIPKVSAGGLVSTDGSAVTQPVSVASLPLPSGAATSANQPALVKSSVPTVNGGSDYETVAASQTAQALGATGATGDYLSHCVLQPTTTGAGTMTILDNVTVIFTFTTGTLSNLAPIAIPVGALSVSGAWKITTGANETATCFGKFT